ncbi:hypothetical protein Tco_1121821 [Tanacetum coccineum]|uniref:Uncharacterized protein n=1 Tax=Tanacetum coccineum TaxID=301880 RepID=A0ABQ5IZT0_9ASTR
MNAKKKVRKLAKDEEIAIKVQEDWKQRGDEKAAKLHEEEEKRLQMKREPNLLYDTIAAQEEVFLAQQRKKHADLKNKNFKEIQVLYKEVKSTLDSEIIEIKYFVSKLHKVLSPDGDYLVVYRVNGHFRAFNYLMENNQKEWEIFRWGLYEACGDCILELKDRTIIYMLVERRYPLSKELLQRMLDLGLEVEEESTAALHLVRFIKQQLNEE